MKIIKRDGSLQEARVDKILHSISRASRGISDVYPLEIAKRTISSLRDGITSKELDYLSIENALGLIVEEPNYSIVAARILINYIKKEVGEVSSFRDYIEVTSNFNLINDKVLNLAKDNIEKLEYAIAHERDDLFDYFGLKTLYDRYLLKNPETRLVIERPQWMFMRVSLGLSSNIEEAIEFYNIISQFLYMPSTPTLFNSGSLKSQMSSCYLLTVPDDSLDSIYKSYTDCAKLSKWSGGIGIDWTKIRSSGSLIRGTNGKSNGIIPFLKVLDSSVLAVNQGGGKRKGAAAVYIENWHADIEEFLKLRNNTGSDERRTHNLNLALWISDLFMKRVEADEMWSLFNPYDVPELTELYGEEFELKYIECENKKLAIKKISARSLYAEMIRVLIETGNGWMCFKDISNNRSAQTGGDKKNIIRSSNLCTEILEVSSGDETAVCNLGSINLSKFVDNKSINFKKLKNVVRTAVRFLDKTIDINYYPIDEAERSNKNWRPIGLGIMGLQDLFFKLKIPFDSQEAKELSEQIMEFIYFYALSESVNIAKSRGRFVNFLQSKYDKNLLQFDLAENYGVKYNLSLDWQELKKEISEYGLRNSLLLAIAPTATIASIVGCYECIEPQISNLFKRETLSGEFIQINRYLVTDLKSMGLWNDTVRRKIIQNEGSIQDIDEIPDDLKKLYKTVWEISQKDLIDMASNRSAFICQSQSLNLFVESPTIQKVSSMYMYLWKSALKTSYYLRTRSKTKIQKTSISLQKDNNTKDLSCSLENPENCEVCQ